MVQPETKLDDRNISIFMVNVLYKTNFYIGRYVGRSVRVGMYSILSV